MGSVITQVPTGINGDITTYLQFVPGQVVEVCVNSAAKIDSGMPQDKNSIIALPHITTKPLKETMLTTQHRYLPLLRGMQDVPVKGDPVLLCTIGGQNYYLGPLNSGGSPNFNKDMTKKVDVSVAKGSTDPVSRAGVSLNFPMVQQARLQKHFNDDLDAPEGLEKPSIADIHGDMMFEGRHGNSIRIGSRHSFPYMMISNGRTTNGEVETTKDGCLISLTQYGTLAQHYKNDGYMNTDTDEVEILPFSLADSKLDEPLRTIEGTYGRSLGRGLLNEDEEYDAFTDIYEYNKPQMLLTSDRITLNSRSDSIFISSFQHIHFGAGNAITFSTSNNFLISAETTTVIDSPIIKLGTDNNDDTEPLVLGNALVDFLNKMMVAIKKINTNIQTQVFATGAGPTSPGPTNSPAFKAINDIDFKALEDSIEEILSKTNRTT